MREVVLDTETTGLDPRSGDRIVEIGCIELMNHIPTGAKFHKYVNPERDMPDQAFAVHGLSREFLSKHPKFTEIADELLEFIGDATLVIHNAAFDLGFLNAELERLERGLLSAAQAIDTVVLARKKFPGAPANLDALCSRFNIDNSDRQLHGALKDARLLADVYLELIGGRQAGLELMATRSVETTQAVNRARTPRLHAATPEEEARHATFVATLSAPLWNE